MKSICAGKINRGILKLSGFYKFKGFVEIKIFKKSSILFMLKKDRFSCETSRETKYLIFFISVIFSVFRLVLLYHFFHAALQNRELR